jgi:hypothetical protein
MRVFILLAVIFGGAAVVNEYIPDRMSCRNATGTVLVFVAVSCLIAGMFVGLFEP